MCMKPTVEWKCLDLAGTTSTQQEKRWIGDSEGHHCLCVCFWFLQRKPFFFNDAICATARKACIVCKCKSLMNDHCVEALMTIPFELPTLLFFHGFKLYAKENKAVMDIFWLSNYVKWNCPYVLFVMARSRVQDGLRKEQKFNKLDSKLKNTDIYIPYSLLRMSILTLTVLVPQHLLILELSFSCHNT